MKLCTLCLVLVVLCATSVFGQSTTVSLLNPQVSGAQLTFDLYAKNTGSSTIYLVDCSFYIRFDHSKWTSPSISFASSLPSNYASSVTVYPATSPRVFGVDVIFNGSPSASNTVQLSSSGNGTKIGTVTITGISTFTGTAGVGWPGTPYLSHVFRWDPQTSNSVEVPGTFPQPPDVYLGPVFDVVVRNQSLTDQEYTFDIFVKKTDGQPLHLGNSTLKIALNSASFTNPTATVVSRGSSRLTDFYTYTTQMQGSTLTLTITGPATATQAEFDSRVQTISGILNGTRLATISVTGVNTPVAIGAIAPTWQTGSGGSVVRTRRSVASWTDDDVTANGTFLVIDPVVSLSLTAPNGGQTLCAGTTQQVQWSSGNVQRVRLELIPEAGGAPVTVASSLSATSGTYSWTVPQTPGVYRMKVSDPANTALSDMSNAPFSIQIPATMTTQPASQVVCEGATVTFTSAGGGVPAPAIRWQVSTDGSTWQDVAGATGASLVLPGVTLSMSGNRYRVQYTSACSGELTSTAATLTVHAPPVYVLQPSAVTVCAGADAVFSVQITGVPTPSIQWQVSTNGGTAWAAIPGATTTQVVIPAVQPAHNGNLYRVVLSNSCGQNVLSANALLTVYTAPVVQQHPESITSCSGSTVVLTAAATGTPTPIVRWQVSTNGGGDWTDIPGATAMQLTLPGITPGMNGRMYRAVFSGACPPVVVTAAATLTVGTALQITAQPQNATVCQGADASFTVGVTGVPAPTISWQRSTDGSSWTTIAGQTSPTLTLPAVVASMNGMWVRATLVNVCSPTTTTASALLTVQTPPRLTAQPQEVVTCTGATVTFTVAVEGSPAPALQWQVQTPGGQWQNLSGQTTAELRLPSVQASQHGYSYRATASNPCGTVTSGTASLWLLVKPDVALQPQDIAVCEGATALIQVGGTGVPQPLVQWQMSLTGGASWNDLPQSTSAVLTLPDVDRSLGDALFRAVLTNSCGTTASSAARLTVNTAPEIALQPAGTTACVGGQAVLTAGATGLPTPLVQWQSSFNGGATWVDIAGATAPVLLLGDVRMTQHQTLYRAVYTNLCGSAATDGTAMLSVRTAPRVVSQPVSQTVVVEESVVFSAAAEVDGPVSYQWYRGQTLLADGGRFSGTRTPELRISTVQPQDVSNGYHMVVTGTCGADTSDFAALNIEVPGIAIASQPKGTAVCQGGTVELSVAASTDVEGAELSYRWRRGNTELTDGGRYSGTATPVLRIADVSTAEAATDYNVQITVEPGGATTYSNNAALRVDVLPTITGKPASVAVCEGEPAAVEVVASGSAPLSYRWLHNGEEIPGATEARYVLPSVSAATAGEYECVVSNICGSATSDQAVVALRQSTEVVDNPQDVAGTLGRDFTVAVTAVGAAPLTYQWYRNGEPVPGATQAEYTHVALSPSSAGEYYCIVRGACGADTSQTAVVAIAVGVADESAGGTWLGQNYPNPFGGTTSIPVVVARDGEAELLLRDAFGREVLVLHRGFLARGQHLFTIDAAALPSGVYFCTFHTGGRTLVRSVLLAR